MTSIREQFIDATSREIHRQRWRDPHGEGCLCDRCAGRGETPSFRWVLERAPVQQYDRDTACIWIGHLEHANGCTVEEIVRAAEDAERDNEHAECRICHDPKRLHCWRSVGADHFEATEPGGVCTLTHCSFVPPDITRAFAESITTEALWKGRGEKSGPSWFDEHARFGIGDTVTARAHIVGDELRIEKPIRGKSLVIPPLNLTEWSDAK